MLTHLLLVGLSSFTFFNYSAGLICENVRFQFLILSELMTADFHIPWSIKSTISMFIKTSQL